jgi:alpha-2-macroglobulin
MKKSNRSILSICIISIIILPLLSCGGTKPGTALSEQEYRRETAEIISHITQNLIEQDEVIRVRFTEPVASQAAIGGKVDPSVFSFKPGIKGSAMWEDERTLILEPLGELPARTNFSGSLDLDKLFSDTAALVSLKSQPAASQLDRTATGEDGLNSIPISFATRGREITGLTQQFIRESGSTREKLRYAINLELSTPLPLETVYKAVSFTRQDLTDSGPDEKIGISVEQGKNDLEFVISSEIIHRGQEAQEFQLYLDGNRLGISEDLKKNVSLASLDTFAITALSIESNGMSPYIRLDFSDDLDQSQDVTGFVRTNPYVEVAVKKMGSSLYLQGDFAPGEGYEIIIEPGIRSEFGTRTEIQVQHEADMEDLKPEISFIQSGVFLPTSGNKRIFFKTQNLRSVHVEVKKVFENNLGQFLQTEQLSSAADRNREFDYTYTNRVGVTVAEEKITIGEEKNSVLVSELNLENLIDSREKGLYLVSLTFEREDMIWDFDEDEYEYYYGDEYYSNPASWGYIWSHGRAYKPVMVSDIGLTWKAGRKNHTVFATDILNAGPMRGVRVVLKTYQNQTIAEGFTDNSGRIDFPAGTDNVFYIFAEKGAMRSVIKANEMAWNLSSFDTGGKEEGEAGTRAFIYTDRGVHRPGDTVYLSAIFRNEDGSFPSGHPVTLTVINPLGQTYVETTNNKGSDGFYKFDITTAEDDPTGNWLATMTAGAAVFSHSLKIETVVPNRLKVNIKSEKESITPKDAGMTIGLGSSYLFGAPASGLEAELDVTIYHREKTFSQFPGFRFTHDGLEYQEINQNLYRGFLDKSGNASILWELPILEGAPSALSAVLNGRVMEKGGRATSQQMLIPADPYWVYAGFQKPDMKYGYAQIGADMKVPAILLDADGNVVEGEEIAYRIYKNDRYWWWEYDSYESFRVRYKTDSNTELIEAGSIKSGSRPVSITFRPEDWGEYLLEIEAPSGQGGRQTRSGLSQNNHKAGFFFRASSWADQAVGEDEGTLSLSAERKTYEPGEQAKITCLTPSKGTLLVTVEKSSQILSSKWIPVQAGETTFSIPITGEMLPTVYISVSLFQPHSQTVNDRPIRMYGILPLEVVQLDTKQKIDIIMPGEIEPGSDFSVTVQTADRRPTQFTIAIVDEGLLDLTAFRTPDPWKNFYSKLRLGIRTYDLFSQVIGAYSEDIFRTFSIGGGEDMAAMAFERAGKGGPEESKSRRFEPVAIFEGPVKTDSRGRAELSFTMPNYMGSVRVMVVSASNNRYGKTEKTVPVRSSLVMLPTLPRVLGPGESIVVPVSIFALEDGLGPIKVSIDETGPVTVAGPRTRTINLDKNDEREVTFNINSLAELGTADITIIASSERKTVTQTIHLPVRASSTLLFRTEEQTIRRGEKASFEVPSDGIKGSSRLRFTVHRRGDLNIGHRLGWLIHYPYGCIEQTTSAVFPQLFLHDFIKTDKQASSIDKNVTAGIERLKSFQLPNGGFSYWPGDEELSIWGTNYAGHFLLEAEEQGYPISPALRDNWIRFQNSRALTTRDTMMERVYRLYLLALAGIPSIGPMNLIKENSLGEMQDVEKWLLAGAYYLAGMENVSKQILRRTGTTVGDYQEFGGTYGSSLRDQAMIMEMAVLLKRWDVADAQYKIVSVQLSSEDWYSTQTTAYSLMAVGKYLAALEPDETPFISGEITLKGGQSYPFKTEESIISIDVPAEEGESSGSTVPARVMIDQNTSLDRVFVSYSWEGIPLRAEDEQVSENLSMSVRYYDKNGREMRIENLKQGTEFWVRFNVRKSGRDRADLEEVALTQIFPSGWEIVNTRLTNEANPGWMQKFRLGSEEYLDIRDDRINWFFDMNRSTIVLDFVVKMQAVTAGTFSLPSAVCGAMYRNDYRATYPGGIVTVTQ